MGITLLIAVTLAGWIFVYLISFDAAAATATLPLWLLLGLLATPGVLWAAWLDAQLIRDLNIDFVFLAYSDLSHEDVMHKASLVQAYGASFALLGSTRD